MTTLNLPDGEFINLPDFDRKTRMSKDNERILISTVELPSMGNLDLGYRYETMIFPVLENGDTDYAELDCYRYATREEAQNGHDSIVWEKEYDGWTATPYSEYDTSDGDEEDEEYDVDFEEGE